MSLINSLVKSSTSSGLLCVDGPRIGTTRYAMRFIVFQFRRFTTFWVVHGTASDEAQRLIRHRGAQVIGIEDADEISSKPFSQKVESIEAYSDHIHSR